LALRDRVEDAVAGNRLDEIDELVAREPRAVRYLVGLTYRPDAEMRRVASRGIALAARHHPALVESVIRRLVWAMNDESGTNAVTAPEVLRAIADERPELLLPVVPDLTRLAADQSLKEVLAETLGKVAERCPGKVGQAIESSLNRRLARGRSNGRHPSC
jgi:hypothetical protein